MVHRQSMPASQRAKQFMPFAAIKGLEEALEQKKRALRRPPRLPLSEEESKALDRALRRLKKGMWVRLSLYEGEDVLTACGRVERIDPANRTLQLLGRTVPFGDIRRLSFEEED